MHARGVQLIAEVGTPGAGAELVVGPEHDVVREELRAPVEEIGEGLPAVLGVELVLLLHPDPGEPPPLPALLLTALAALGLELVALAASAPPVLTGCDFVLGHRRR